MIKTLFAVAAIVMLSACSTKPAVNPTAIAPSLYSTPTTGTVPVTITRDGGIVGSGCRINVFVDDNQVAKLRASESISLFIPAGRHILSIQSGNMCVGVRDAVDVTLKQDEPKKYRISSDMGSNVQLLPTL